jgi:hypothetical protein
MISFKLILADLIYIFHIIVILFVLFTPFTNIPAYLILHLTFCICLLVHWYNNNNICSLSLFESQLRGINYTESFSHKFISPIYDISESDLGKFCYNIVIILGLVSLYKLITSNKWSILKKCYQENKKYLTNINLNEKKELKFNDKIMLYMTCLNILFTN